MHSQMASLRPIILLARERKGTRQHLLSLLRSASTSSSSSSSASVAGVSGSSKLLLSRYPLQSQRRPLAAAAAATTASFHSTTRSLSEETVAAAVDAPPADPSSSSSVAEGEAEAKPNVNDIQWAFTPPPPLSEASQQKVDDLFEKILFLDMIEIHLLTEVVQERLGIEGDVVGDGGMAASAAAGGAVEEEQVEEKKLFEVKLVGFDAKAKIKVIKEVRAISGLGLKEAKEMVESAPKVLQKDLKPEKAEELKAQLEAVGAQVEIV